jgi:hypothetical protein
MSEATAVVEALSGLGPGGKRAVVDCRHGTTTVHLMQPPEGGPLTDGDVIRVALVQHFDAEGCACISELWQRYWGTTLGELPRLRGAP